MVFSSLGSILWSTVNDIYLLIVSFLLKCYLCIPHNPPTNTPLFSALLLHKSRQQRPEASQQACNSLNDKPSCTSAASERPLPSSIDSSYIHPSTAQSTIAFLPHMELPFASSSSIRILLASSCTRILLNPTSCCDRRCCQRRSRTCERN